MDQDRKKKSSMKRPSVLDTDRIMVHHLEVPQPHDQLMQTHLTANTPLTRCTASSTRQIQRWQTPLQKTINHGGSKNITASTSGTVAVAASILPAHAKICTALTKLPLQNATWNAVLTKNLEQPNPHPQAGNWDVVHGPGLLQKIQVNELEGNLVEVCFVWDRFCECPGELNSRYDSK